MKSFMAITVNFAYPVLTAPAAPVSGGVIPGRECL
jgi:hypothetical protein